MLVRGRGWSEGQRREDLPAAMADGTPIEYRQVVGSNAHLVGTDGTVWTCIIRGSKNRRTGERYRRLKSNVGKNGYVVVNGGIGEKRQPSYVHRLLLEAFVGPRPDGAECRHLDGDPLNNHISNLCWGTYLEQAEDKRRHGTLVMGKACRNAKLDDLKVMAARVLFDQGFPFVDIARCLGVEGSTIRSVINGDTWKHVAADWRAQEQLIEPTP